MKSKYRMYMLLCFVIYIGQMGAMEKIDESVKKEWHQLCICSAMGIFLEENTPGLSFEIIGSKRFIAERLCHKLDKNDDDLKELAKRRNDIFVKLEKYPKKDHSFLVRESIRIMSIDRILSLLPFILSLEEPIKARIEQAHRTTEIEWRKNAYKHFNSQTSCCKDIRACLKLDIEKDCTPEELRSSDYRNGY